MPKEARARPPDAAENSLKAKSSDLLLSSCNCSGDISCNSFLLLIPYFPAWYRPSPAKVARPIGDATLAILKAIAGDNPAKLARSAIFLNIGVFILSVTLVTPFTNAGANAVSASNPILSAVFFGSTPNA